MNKSKNDKLKIPAFAGMTDRYSAYKKKIIKYLQPSFLMQRSGVQESVKQVFEPV